MVVVVPFNPQWLNGIPFIGHAVWFKPTDDRRVCVHEDEKTDQFPWLDQVGFTPHWGYAVLEFSNS